MLGNSLQPLLDIYVHKICNGIGFLSNMIQSGEVQSALITGLQKGLEDGDFGNAVKQITAETRLDLLQFDSVNILGLLGSMDGDFRQATGRRIDDDTMEELGEMTARTAVDQGWTVAQLAAQMTPVLNR